MCLNPQFPAYLVTCTEEILNGKLHFLCSYHTDDVSCYKIINLSVLQETFPPASKSLSCKEEEILELR